MVLQHNHTPPIQAYYDTVHAVLGIYLTNRCNIECRHCGVNSGPRESAKLSVGIVVNQLSALASSGVVRALHVSGGEPFLYPNDLRSLGAAAERNGLRFGVNTNGFWARSAERAGEIIASIPGLTQLFLSTDAYHEEFIPLERIVNAARAGVAAGINVFVGICTERGLETRSVRRVRQLLATEECDNVFVGAMPVEMGGRASTLEEANWRKKTASYPKGACQQINRPVVLEDGTVFACCNTTISAPCRKSELVLGNAFANNLSDILARARQNNVLRVIRLFGPAVLAALLPSGSQAMLSGEYREGDICSLCADMMSRPELMGEFTETGTASRIQALVDSAEALGLLRAAGWLEASPESGVSCV